MTSELEKTIAESVGRFKAMSPTRRALIHFEQMASFGRAEAGGVPYYVEEAIKALRAEVDRREGEQE